jgi:hypothetical protein
MGHIRAGGKEETLEEDIVLVRKRRRSDSVGKLMDIPQFFVSINLL